MKSNTRFFALVILLFLCSTSFLVLCNRAAENNTGTEKQGTVEVASPEPELAEYMGKLQQYTHKLALSVAAKNQETADFYLHEVEAMAEAIQNDIPEYEGHDIAELMNSMLVPHIKAAEASMDENRWQDARSRLVILIDACNSCHHATDHGFIEVTPGFDINPYNQVF